MTILLSGVGERVPLLTDPEAAPACPRGGCDGTMRPTAQTALTVTVGQIAYLRCEACNQRRWYKQVAAYQLLPADVQI